MASFLILGFLIGMSHALEADHLAAVGVLASSDKPTSKKLVLLGISWGAGHTTTLFVLCAIVIVFGFVLSERMAAGLEFTVGVMLVLLGLHVLWKLYKKRVHFHVHEHGDGNQHLHAHSHQGAQEEHAADPHEHKHGFSIKAYLIGLVHGAAGSAGLIALAAAATRDIFTALGYVLVFGIGSIIGMALLSYAVSWPLRLSGKSAGKMFQAVQILTACVAGFVGIGVMVETAPTLWPVFAPVTETG